MVRQQIVKREEDKIVTKGKYWKPYLEDGKIQDATLEGKVIEIKDTFYESRNLGEVLVIKTPDGMERETPAHKDLQEYLPQIQENDYVWLECYQINIEKNNKTNREYSICLYKVEIDFPEGEG